MSTPVKKKDAEDILSDLHRLNELWDMVKQYLLMAFTTEPLTAEIEQHFLESKSNTSKFLRLVSEKIDSHQFRYDPEKITHLLRQAISVTHLRSLPMADRKNLFDTWHEVHVRLTQVLGAFQLISQGYHPTKKEKKSTSVASLKKGASGRKKKESPADKIAVVALILIIVVAFFIIFKR